MQLLCESSVDIIFQLEYFTPAARCIPWAHDKGSSTLSSHPDPVTSGGSSSGAPEAPQLLHSRQGRHSGCNSAQGKKGCGRGRIMSRSGSATQGGCDFHQFPFQPRLPTTKQDWEEGGAGSKKLKTKTGLVLSTCQSQNGN